MAMKSKTKKVGKALPKQKNKKKSSSLRKDVKKTKLKVESLNKEGTEIAEIIRLSTTGAVRRGPSSLNTLENKSLQRDWKKDKRTQEKSKAEQQEMANKLEKQIESISGFSL